MSDSIHSHVWGLGSFQKAESSYIIILCL